MVHLIFSVDYELFGNGAGDVWRDIVQPTNRMLRIAARYGAKLSLMFEAAEYAAFAEAEARGDWTLPDSPSRAIARQVQETYASGHDVQLHLHPQFIGARRRNGLWQLDHGSTRLADLPGGLGDEHNPRSIVGALADGKRLLEDLLRPVNSSYQCLVLRAGGFFIQPSAKVIQALKQVGIVADSSVVPGAYLRSPWSLDFRAAPRDRSHWWTDENDITRLGPAGRHVLELPVAAHTRPYACNFKWHKLRATLKRRRLERNDPHSEIPGVPQSVPPLPLVARRLLSRQTATIDFCKLSHRDMLRAVLRAAEMSAPEQIDPLVLIGHSKDFWNDRQFELFLCKLQASQQLQGKWCFDTCASVVKKLTDRARLGHQAA